MSGNKRGNMRKERFEKGLTIKQVSDAINVHPNAISRWENGDTDPTASNLMALCRLYDCSPEYLLGMTDDKHAAAIAD